MKDYTPTPKFTCVDDVLDSEVQQVYNLENGVFLSPFPYNALDRLADIEIESEQYRAENGAYKAIQEHKEECIQSHYYSNHKGEKVFCCPGCMEDIQVLMEKITFHKHATGKAA